MSDNTWNSLYKHRVTAEPAEIQNILADLSGLLIDPNTEIEIRTRKIDDNSEFIAEHMDDLYFRMPFGKHKGRSLVEINETDPDYLEWAYENIDGFVGKQIENFVNRY